MLIQASIRVCLSAALVLGVAACNHDDAEPAPLFNRIHDMRSAALYQAIDDAFPIWTGCASLWRGQVTNELVATERDFKCEAFVTDFTRWFSPRYGFVPDASEVKDAQLWNSMIAAREAMVRCQLEASTRGDRQALNACQMQTEEL